MQSRLSQILSFIFPLAFLSTSFADVTIQGVSGYSRYTNASTTSGTTTSTSYSIFGGYAGPYGDCAGSPLTTAACNSCSALEGLPNLTKFSCSISSIHPNLDLTITLRFSTIPTNASLIAKVSSGTAQTLTTNVTGSLVANSDITVRIPWSEICDKMSVAGCVGTGNTAHFSTTLEVGLSSNDTDFDTANVQRFTLKYNYRDAVTSNQTLNSGCSSTVPFCSFAVKPGDEKVYVQNLQRGSLGPNSDIKWQALRVYYALSDGGVWNIPMGIGAGAQSADFEILDQSIVDSNLSNNKITGLVNEQDYMFTIGSVDETTLVQDFLSSASLTQADHTAKPGKVVGLLEKKCFIATAAFGSPMAPQVEALRQFRNRYLLTNFLGQKFVEAYYKYSPPVAQFISSHETLRTATRALLWPLVSTANFLIGSQNQTQAGQKNE